MVRIHPPQPSRIGGRKFFRREVNGQTTATGFAGIDFTGVTNAITGVVTPSDIITLMGVVIGGGILFALSWWGGRLIINKLMTAIKTGRLKF